jgi:hypothetical protein
VGRAWRWGNIPVPEAHLGFLVAAGVVTRLLPWPVTRGQTAWPFVLLPALAGTVHREIVGEEQQLSKASPIEFGE